MKFLREFPAFDSVGKWKMLWLKYSFIKQELQRGDHLYTIGELVNGMYFIQEGEFNTYKFTQKVD